MTKVKEWRQGNFTTSEISHVSQPPTVVAAKVTSVTSKLCITCVLAADENVSADRSTYLHVHTHTQVNILPANFVEQFALTHTHRHRHRHTHTHKLSSSLQMAIHKLSQSIIHA